MSRCPLCESRRAKRACPALGRSICPVCCGRKRLVEIECPEDCVYLTGANAPAWDGRASQQRRDAQRLLPAFEGLARDQGALLSQVLSGLVALRRTHRDLDDHVLLATLEAMRRTAETERSGILYEHSPDDLRAQGLMRDVAALFETRDAEGRRATLDERDRLPILSGLVEALRGSVSEGAGSTAFLDAVTRVARATGGGAAKGGSSLIVPP